MHFNHVNPFSYVSSCYTVAEEAYYGIYTTLLHTIIKFTMYYTACVP